MTINQQSQQAAASSGISASSPMPANYLPAPYQKSKMSFGKKVLIGAGSTALLTTLGLLYVGKKLKDWFFPPTFKRYAATAFFIFSAYSMTHCSEVKHVAAGVYGDVKKIFVSANEKDKAIAPLLKQIDNLRKENYQMQTNAGKYGAFSKKKVGSRADISSVVDDNASKSSDLENKLSDKNKNLASIDESKIPEFSSYTSKRTSTSVKSIENMISKYGGDYGNLIYVDKLNQTLTVYDMEQGKAIEFKAFRCTTGKNPMSKNEEGDLATPEGIYLINSVKMGIEGNSLLGYGFLGVNYPNSQDKQRNRTGGGVGISGTSMDDRVEAILNSRVSTNGCVSLQNSDLKALYSHIRYGINKTLVVFENPQRPLKFEGVGVNE